MVNLVARAAVVSALECASEEVWPYRHWLLRDVLDDDTLAGLKAWAARGARGPITPSAGGRRRTERGGSWTPTGLPRFGPDRALAEAFQDTRVVSALEARCGASLAGTNLRIEYAQDTEGFWLEPHTDIGEKALTMFIYLGRYREKLRDWGYGPLFRPKQTRKATPLHL